jgi:hypothetical protein
VDFKVVYRKDKNNKKIVVAETVREQIVKTGKLGNYQVKSAVVQGKIFYLVHYLASKNKFVHYEDQCTIILFV